MPILSDELLEKKPYIVPIYKHLSIDRFKYLFWNATRKTLLEGKFADKILPELLPKLDGTHTLREITADLGHIKEEDIIETITFLEERGFLQEKTVDDTPYSDEELDFFKHLLNYFRHFGEDPLKYFNLLKNSQVGLILNGPVGFSAGLHLATLGIGHLIIADTGTITADEVALCPGLTDAEAGKLRSEVLKNKIESSNPYIDVSLISIDVQAGSFTEFLEYSHFVLLCDEDNRGILPALFNTAAVESGKSFIPVTLSGFSGKIGPVVVPGQTPCIQCLKAREAAVSENFEEETKISELLSNLDGEDFSYRPPAAILSMIGEIAAVEASRVISGYTQPVTLNNILFFNSRHLAIDAHPVLKVPRCKVCGRLNDIPDSRVWGF